MRRLGANALHYRIADPAAEGLDQLDGGSTEAGLEEQRYFQSRAWTGVLDGREARCLEFVLANGQVVGYAAFQIVEKEHPTRKSRAKAEYLFIYHLCLDARFQGQRDLSVEEQPKWSVLVMRAADEIATREGCAGTYLNVRADNERAKALYEALGYRPDGEYVRKGTDVMMLRMRNVLT